MNYSVNLTFILGRKMKLRLVRNGVEEPWFQYDEHYDFDYQQTRRYRNYKQVHRGDSFILGILNTLLRSISITSGINQWLELFAECSLDSNERDNVTLGGFGTDDEMCLAFLSYYPRAEMARCMTYFNQSAVQEVLGFQDLIMDELVFTA
jgi:hypothetical protein